MEKCEGCDLYDNGSCTKFRKNGKCNPSTRDWFAREEYGEQIEFIPVERMCRKTSIFGNDFIGLTQEDIDRIKNGEVIHLGGEYGIFIGFVTEDAK